jgi:hypothetical protein
VAAAAVAGVAATVAPAGFASAAPFFSTCARVPVSTPATKPVAPTRSAATSNVERDQEGASKELGMFR